jgi:transcriptional regulator with XRE-family HTH domain
MTTLPYDLRPGEAGEERARPRRGRGRPRVRCEGPPEDEDDEGRRKLIDRIEDLRESRGYTQAELEERAGLARNRISKWKKTSEPNARQLPQIAQALGVTISDLIGESATPKPDRPPPNPTPDRSPPEGDLDLAIAALVRKLGSVRAIQALASALREDRAAPLVNGSPGRPG